MTKKGRGKFLEDLKRGSVAEELVSELLRKAGFPSHPDKTVKIEWDVMSLSPGGSFTTEVKYDEYESKSGNIAIEIYNTRLGRPSGITATKAFFWAHVLVDYVVWITRVNALKDYIDKHEPFKTVDRGGDNNAAIYLYQSCTILPDVFTRIDDIKPKQLTAYINRELKNHGQV